MSTSTINGFLSTSIASLTDVVETNIPLALAIGIGIFAVFVGWRLIKRFAGGR